MKKKINNDNGVVTLGTKKIVFEDNSDNIDYYRELPYKMTDLSIVYYLAYQSNSITRKTDYLGAILLKWIKLGNAKILDIEQPGIFKVRKDKYLYLDNVFGLDKYETKLFQMMYEASFEGKLFEKEFVNWCKRNNIRMLGWFDDVIDSVTDRFIEENKLILDISSNTYSFSDDMLEMIKKIKGLKLFLNDFTNIKDRETIYVKLFEEYLMYAQIFGIADKVMNEFKDIYPDIISEFNFDEFMYLDHMYNTSADAMLFSKMMDTAEETRLFNYRNTNYDIDISSFSSGKFSSSSGGGGSFGGGSGKSGGGGGGFR